MNIDKVKDRIRKLLAMARDAASPNEAAIAARRAQKLMETYQLEEGSLEDHVFGEYFTKTGNKTAMQWRGYLAAGIGYLTCTKVRWARDPDDLRYKSLRWFGHNDDVALADYLYEYLTGQIDSWARKRKVTRSESGSYRMGMAVAIQRELKRIMRDEPQGEGDGKSLVLKDTKLSKIAELDGARKFARSRAKFSNSAAFDQGKADGAKVSIRRGVSSGSTSGYLA